MAFELPDNLHPDCAPVAWLLGRWGGRGKGDYPTIEPFEYGQELVFTHDGRPFFHYFARSWIVDDDGEKVRDAAQEAGFLRCRPGGDLELVLSHSSGHLRDLVRQGRRRQVRAAHRRRRLHRVGQGGHRRQAAVRQRRERPALRLRHGGHGPAAPAAPVGAAGASVAPMTDELASRLHSLGYRLTPQRQLVLQAVEKLGHATPDEILAEVQQHASAVNVSTVYRTLEVLEELGLVRHAHLSDRAPTYHSVTDHEHFHLVCRNCHRVVSVDPEVVAPFAARLREEQGFVIDVGHLAIFGECVECEDTMRSPLLDLPGAVAGDGIDRDVAAHYGSFNGEQRTLESGDGLRRPLPPRRRPGLRPRPADLAALADHPAPRVARPEGVDRRPDPQPAGPRRARVLRVRRRRVVHRASPSPARPRPWSSSSTGCAS